jgi:hypothetical protein
MNIQKLIDKAIIRWYNKPNTVISKEQAMDLIERLNKAGEEVQTKFRFINYGGCCVYATMIVRELKKHGIEAVGIATGGYLSNDKTIDEVRGKVKNNSVSEWNRNGISFHHVAVEFVINGRIYHYDTNGVRPAHRDLTGFPIYEGRFNFAEMRELSKQRNLCWNTRFDRWDIPAIRRIVKKHLAVDKAQTKVV